jgi:hypothetical protein
MPLGKDDAYSLGIGLIHLNTRSSLDLMEREIGDLQKDLYEIPTNLKLA